MQESRAVSAPVPRMAQVFATHSNGAAPGCDALTNLPALMATAHHSRSNWRSPIMSFATSQTIRAFGVRRRNLPRCRHCGEDLAAAAASGKGLPNPATLAKLDGSGRTRLHNRAQAGDPMTSNGEAKPSYL